MMKKIVQKNEKSIDLHGQKKKGKKKKKKQN